MTHTFEHATESLVPGALVAIPDGVPFRTVIAVVKHLRLVGNAFVVVYRGRAFTLNGAA